MKLIKLNSTDNNGQVSPVLINTATIEMVQPDEVGNSQIFFVGHKLDICITVVESVAEIAALASGQVTQEFLPVTVEPAKVGSESGLTGYRIKPGDIVELTEDQTFSRSPALPHTFKAGERFVVTYVFTDNDCFNARPFSKQGEVYFCELDSGVWTYSLDQTRF